jgi:hypothetical protein
MHLYAVRLNSYSPVPVMLPVNRLLEICNDAHRR